MAITTIRSIIEIDEEKCDGCGQCVPACEEGAIQIVDGKARLVQERFCDGLGACLGECPRGAITIVEREAEDFDEEAAKAHVERSAAVGPSAAHSGCPASRAMAFGAVERQSAGTPVAPRPPQLRNWPVQLTLVPVGAPWLEGAELLICADCVPFACADFHEELLAGHQVITACPKLDQLEPYLEKLTAIFSEHELSSVTVARMEVPCCGGLQMLIEEALRAAGREVPVETVVVTIEDGALHRM